MTSVGTQDVLEVVTELAIGVTLCLALIGLINAGSALWDRFYFRGRE